jgi:hypothetical protein
VALVGITNQLENGCGREGEECRGGNILALMILDIFKLLCKSGSKSGIIKYAISTVYLKI